MSRRRARGPAARRREVERAARCPDCASDVRVIWHDGALTRVEVRHDDCCPLWRARGEQPFRELRLLAPGAPR